MFSPLASSVSSSVLCSKILPGAESMSTHPVSVEYDSISTHVFFSPSRIEPYLIDYFSLKVILYIP